MERLVTGDPRSMSTLRAVGLLGITLVAACNHDDDVAPATTNAASTDAAAPVATTPGAPAAPPALDAGVGAYPTDDSPPTRGGTMTFTHVGAAGWWPRRIDRESGDPACNVKDGTDTWGGACCLTEEHTDSTTLAPFDQEMTLILKALDLKQLAVYQPAPADTGWALVSAWDRRTQAAQNLTLTTDQTISDTFTGELQHDDCVHYLAQSPSFDCGDGHDYFCPNDPGVKQLGWSHSKLFVVLAGTDFEDASVASCGGSGTPNPGPWMALVASELIRDGGRKWNGLCNCYSKTGTVGDGCGEINLFEVVMDEGPYKNREFASTGVRSYQAGHVGGSVCGADCARDAFADDVDVVDACAKQAYDHGPVIDVGGASDGCPVWRRPRGDRYFFVLLDEITRQIQIAMVHPSKLPTAAAAVVPALPARLDRSTIDALLTMRLPEAQ